MDFSKLVDSVLRVVETAAPLLGPAGVMGVAAAKAITALVTDTKEVLASSDQHALQSRLDDALARMNANFGKTIDSLD